MVLLRRPFLDALLKPLMPQIPPQIADRVQFILKGFADDKFGIHHCIRLLIWELDDGSVAGVLEVVPSDVRTALRKAIKHMPQTDKQWEQWIDLYTATIEFSPTTLPEQIVHWQQDGKHGMRRGIEALRNYFASHAV